MREIELFKELYVEIMKDEYLRELHRICLEDIQIIAYKWFLDNYPTISVHKMNIIVETIHELINLK